MNKLISLAATLVLLGLYKILEYFNLFRPVQVLLALLMFGTFCYGISPILKFFGLFDDGNSPIDTDSYKLAAEIKEREKKEREYNEEMNRLNRQRDSGTISETEYMLWSNKAWNKYKNDH
ncbi:MAG: hypothetical protein HXM14_09170 [Fusobacterium periodonticum]|nr:hypothetical protein [Fusobacterium periodonticum]